MTHKNPELRASGIVRVSESASPSVVNSTTSLNAAKKPAKFALEGHKWCIENQEGNQGIVVDNTELKQVVYIYNCTNSVIQIKGKVNAVVVGMLISIVCT